MADYTDKPLDHDYDGIRELDNDLPRWWLWLFYASIIYAVIYMFYYHVLDIGYSSSDAYHQEVDPSYVRERDTKPTYLGIVPRYRSPLALLDEEKGRTDKRPARVHLTRETDTVTYFAVMDDATLRMGERIYGTRCASCHGLLGEGGVGPNLTDAYWVHGADFSSVVRTVRYGYPTKGMIAWLGQLTGDDIVKVSSFVTTLQGTNPPNPKAPEGEPTGEP